jgi:two-component system response regulator
MQKQDSVKLRPVTVLLVEDNPGDVELARIAFDESGLGTCLHVVGDGEEAMAFLWNKGQYGNAPRPDLILLDLNLPKKDGREVLAEIKNDEELKTIPVVILTTSNAEEDVHQLYDLNANCYIPKPLKFDQFIEIIRLVERFWLTMAVLPGRKGC